MGEYRSCVTLAGCNTCRIGATNFCWNHLSLLPICSLHRVGSQKTLKDDKPGNDEQVPTTTQEQEKSSLYYKNEWSFFVCFGGVSHYHAGVSAKVVQGF